MSFNNAFGQSICDRYWRSHYLFLQPISALTFLIWKFWSPSEQIDDDNISDNVEVTNTNLTAHYPSKTPSHNYNISQTVFLTTVVIPQTQRVTWSFNFAIPYPPYTPNGPKSMCVGLTNNTTWCHLNPMQALQVGSSIKDIYIGYEVYPRAIFEYDLKKINEYNRFNHRELTVWKGRFSCSDWNNTRHVIVDPSEEKVDPKLEYGDTVPDIIFGQMKFEVYRDGEHLCFNFAISQYPNQLVLSKNDVNNSAGGKWYRVGNKRLENLGLAVTIPSGGTITLIQHHFGDAIVSRRMT